jgi:ribosome maturation factor RimP
VLEVSSPGIDRPFRTDHDYQRSVGRTVRITFEDEAGKVMQSVGLLTSVDNGAVTIEKQGEIARIERDHIRRAQQEIPMPAHPIKRRKKRK